MRQYFDLIHNQERVEYLMLQQNVFEYIAQQEKAQLLFLAESDEKIIKKRLNDEDGVRYYEKYLGKGAKNFEEPNHILILILHVAIALIITSCIVLFFQFFWEKFSINERQTQINFDCKQAIEKKKRLEQDN